MITKLLVMLPILFVLISVAFCQNGPSIATSIQFTAIDNSGPTAWNSFTFYIDPTDQGRFRLDSFFGGPGPVDHFAESQITFGVPERNQVIQIYSNSRQRDFSCSKTPGSPPYFSYNIAGSYNTTFFHDRLTKKFSGSYYLSLDKNPQQKYMNIYLDAFSNDLLYGIGGDNVLFNIKKFGVMDNVFDQWKEFCN